MRPEEIAERLGLPKRSVVQLLLDLSPTRSSPR
jgi:hypothetical protein